MLIPVPEKRVAKFENLGFGMFVHWGLYSELGRGEWVMHREKIPKNEYRELIHHFTAENFDSRKWVRMAKNAGARYITFTTRHHDGFSLYNTCGLSDFDVMRSSCGRDLVEEFVEACREEGIKPFFYHTTLDWYSDLFEDDFPAYLQYLRDSVEILCTRYGAVGGFWFDGNWSKPNADWEEDKLYAVIRKYQPDAVIVNNTGLGKGGKLGNPEIDCVTFEQGRPSPMDHAGMDKYVAAEMCQTMNAHWGCGTLDLCYKSLPTLIETLCACRKVGANYLLNVGPMANGDILPMQRVLMEGLGEWIDATGGTIYCDKPCGGVCLNDAKNFVLRSGNKLHFYIHGLSVAGIDTKNIWAGSTGDRFFWGIREKVKRVRWTDCDEWLDFSQEGEMLRLHCTGFPYGKNLIVRVAEAEIEETGN